MGWIKVGNWWPRTEFRSAIASKGKELHRLALESKILELSPEHSLPQDHPDYDSLIARVGSKMFLEMSFRNPLIKALGISLATFIVLRNTPVPKIVFVDNFASAFFDVENPLSEPMDVAEIGHGIPWVTHNQLHNLEVMEKQVDYFKTGYDELPLRTVSVTSFSMIFCAFTRDGNGGIKSSGVYHANSRVISPDFKRLYRLIDTVRAEPGEEVTVKAAGSHINTQEYLQGLEKEITETLAERGVEVKPEHLVLGGKEYLMSESSEARSIPYKSKARRVTEFDPRNGQLITYFEGDEQKTII